MNNRSSPFRLSTEDGSPSMAVPFKFSLVKLSIASKISGNFFRFEQPPRLNSLRHLNLQMLVERLLSLVQPPMLNFTSLTRNSTY
uniref:Uncharacterized protein n=1 Tax=Rhizophora mucronata TaxID=61149 RepID=A0A2P2N0B7_RHIMU